MSNKTYHSQPIFDIHLSIHGGRVLVLGTEQQADRVARWLERELNERLELFGIPPVEHIKPTELPMKFQPNDQ